MKRVSSTIEATLINQQVGFRGRSHVPTKRNLNSQYNIEKGYELRKITVVVFMDVSTRYNIVNYRLQLNKIYVCHDKRSRTNRAIKGGYIRLYVSRVIHQG